MPSPIAYEDEFVTLYHGDAIEHPEWWTFDAESIVGDCLVTDPPYGVGYYSRHNWKKGATPEQIAAMKANKLVGDEDTGLRDKLLSLWGDAPAIVFGSWQRPRPKQIRQLVIWDKGNAPGMGDVTCPWGPAFEEIYVMGEGFIGPRVANVIRVDALPANDNTWGRGRVHPTQKPIELMEQLIRHCPPEWVIVDPCAGSGSTLVAAKNLGRKAIGVEVSEKYCRQAAARCAQEVMKFHVERGASWLLMPD